MFSNNSGLTPTDVLALNNNDSFGNGNGFWWIILLAVLFGWGGNYGGFGGANGATTNYVLSSDFATIQRQLSDGFGATESKLDTVNSGLCSLGYETLGNFSNLGMNVMQGFNNVQTQLADCCCKTQSGIERVNTNNAMNTATITSAIKDCCCDTDKQFMQINYNMATQNCATLQAIDKVGDRIIDYLNTDKTQALRDENQALRLASSQSMQNQYLISQLRPTPVPSFNVGVNPFAYGYGYGYNGTTIA